MSTSDLTAASCADDGDMWFSKDHRDITLAVTICNGCPILYACLEQTLRAEGQSPSGQRHGVAGGLTPNQRARRRPLGRPSGRALQPCGTPAAYRRHIRSGQKACEPCLAANRAITYVSMAKKVAA